MTPEDIARVVTRGTTTKCSKVKVLYSDDEIALVKWPGEYDGRHFCRGWISSWVTLYRLQDLEDTYGRYGRGVWDVGKDGRLTAKRLAELVKKCKKEKL